MMRTNSILGAALAGLVLASGCTGIVTRPGDTTSTGGSGAGGTGATTSTTSTTATGGTGGTGGSTVTDTACEAWVDMKGIATQTLRFVNQTGQALYLPTLCDGRVSFALSGSSSPGSASYVYDTSCLQTCAMLQTEPPFACGACLPTSIRLGPGETRDVGWDGTSLQSVLMLPSCFFSPSSGPCPEIQAAMPDTYTATALGYAACDGACSCDAQGVCTGAPSGAATQAMATFAFPGSGPVEVVFGP